MDWNRTVNAYSFLVTMSESASEEEEKKKMKITKLRALGFCGADDSVNPKLLGLFSNMYPFVEFGVLFRPDKEGTPR